MLKAARRGFGPEGVGSGAVILPLRQATELNSSACFVAISRPAKVSCFAMLVMSRCGMWQRRLCQTCNVVGEGVRSVTWRGEGFLVRGGGEEEAEARCTSSSSRSKKYRPCRREPVATTRPEARSKTVAPASVKRQSKPLRSEITS